MRACAQHHSADTRSEGRQGAGKGGFTVVRIKGSHYFMRHSDGRRAVVVPVHAGDDVPRGTMRQILASAELTPDEFRALL